MLFLEWASYKLSKKLSENTQSSPISDTISDEVLFNAICAHWDGLTSEYINLKLLGKSNLGSTFPHKTISMSIRLFSHIFLYKDIHLSILMAEPNKLIFVLIYYQ